MRTVALFAGCYLVADLAINRLAFSDGWTILWPLNGFSVGFLIRRPRATWVWAVLGIEIGTGVGELFDGNRLGYEIFQRACSASEILICALILPPFERLDAWLRADRFAVRLMGALVLGPGVSGLVAATHAAVTGSEPATVAFDHWALADALGIATTLPLALSLSSAEMRAWLEPAKITHFISVLFLTSCIAAIALANATLPLLFVVYPALLFTDLALGFAGSAIAILAVALLGVFCATHGLGPFGNWSASAGVSRDHALQLYLGFHAVILLPASIILMERRLLAAELKSSNERLSVLANSDGLTGLANRRAFDEQLSSQWQRAVETGAPIGLALIDLDNFKAFNDLYGHAAGDRCLRAVARSIADSVQHTADLAARFGGEEFVLLLPATDREGVRQVADRIREAIYRLAIPHRGNPPDRASVSIGYAAVEPGAHDTPLSLIQLADAALYRAKDAGRNCVRTVSTADGLNSAKDHFGQTTRVRLLKLIGLPEHQD